MSIRLFLPLPALALFLVLSGGAAFSYDLPQVCMDAHQMQNKTKNPDLHRIVQLYDQCLQGNLSPANKGVTYLNRGVARKKVGDLRGAMADYSEAIRLVPNDPTKHYNRALLYHDMGDYGKAIEGYSKAISLNPGFAKAYGNRAFSFKAVGDIPRAREDARKALELNPSVKVPQFDQAKPLASRKRFAIQALAENFPRGLFAAVKRGKRVFFRIPARPFSRPGAEESWGLSIGGGQGILGAKAAVFGCGKIKRYLLNLTAQSLPLYLKKEGALLISKMKI